MKRRKKISLTYERLKSLLHYESATGRWTWLVNKGRVKAGDEAGHVNLRYQRRLIRVDRVCYKASRLAWFYMMGQWPKDEVDHKSNDSLDNRFANLREATHRQNGCNRGQTKNNKTGFKGVFKRYGQFKARIRVNGKLIYGGNFNTPEEAHEAYKRLAIKYFGEFARW